VSISRLLSSLLIAGAVSISLPAAAQEVRIAAVVNDDIISVTDLTARTRLALISASFPDTAENRQRVTAQVMRTLIDEKLELQEAKRLNVTISDKELDEQYKHLEQVNNMPAGGLDRFLAGNNIDRTVLIGQLRAQLTWQRLIRRRMGSNVGVGEDEITDELKRFETDRDRPQDRVAEIFLSVDSPDQDADVQRTADHLVDEIRHGGDFAKVARQFSQSATAAIGGDVGWVPSGTLDPRADEVIKNMKPGQMSPPVRLSGGWFIYYLIDRRTGGADSSDVTVNLTQVVFPLPDTADTATRQAMIERARQATAGARSCGELAKIGQTVAPQTSGNIGRVRLNDLPPDLRPTLAAAKVSEPTAPMSIRGGVGVLMVCEREGGTPVQETRDEAAETLARQRLENLARRYLRDLRRVSFIDMRV